PKKGTSSRSMRKTANHCGTFSLAVLYGAFPSRLRSMGSNMSPFPQATRCLCLVCRDYEQSRFNAETAEAAEQFLMLLKATTKARRHEERQRTFRVFVSSWLHFP